MLMPHMPDASDNSLLGLPIRREHWAILGRAFDLSWPADMNALLDAEETHERFRRDEYMPYWAQPWPSAVVLAEAVLQGPPGEGRPAIELGCGIGLSGIAAAMNGWSVTVTDYDTQAIAFARINAERSGVTLTGARLLDYRVPLERGDYDLVLASDLLYERRNVEPLARWIASALRPGGTALVSDPNRSAAEGFPDALRGVGLDVHVQAVETRSPAGLLIRGRIWHVAHAGGGRP